MDSPHATPISDHEFSRLRRFLFEKAGITLPAGKKALVGGRLARRLAQCDVQSYGDYERLLRSGRRPTEVQTAINLLTTNETYFFREPKHFAWLRRYAEKVQRRAPPFRVWSAASSSGEEAYSIAMLLADTLVGCPFEVVGTDISTKVLEQARRGHYPLSRCSGIPAPYRKRFCLRGVGPEEGTLLVSRALRDKVRFSQLNLDQPLPSLGVFDVVFLRNVMIYFSAETRRQVVGRVVGLLRPGGALLVGHSETLNDVGAPVRMVSPSIYVKP